MCEVNKNYFWSFLYLNEKYCGKKISEKHIATIYYLSLSKGKEDLWDNFE